MGRSNEMMPGDRARRLSRACRKAALATLDRGTGAPFCSLVTVATDHHARPLLLLSRLARHTKNLEADPRASLLFDGTGGAGDPLQGPRASVSGRLQPVNDPDVRARFLAVQPGAEGYADFADFAFWRMDVEDVHLVEGFGVIEPMSAEAFLAEPGAAGSIAMAEARIVDHMNSDHADAVRLYATRLLGAQDGDWRMAACDCDGCDLVCGEQTLRLQFPLSARTAEEIRKHLVDLVRSARSM